MTYSLEQYAKSADGIVTRAYNLKVKDVFVRTGTRYLVVDISGGFIWYSNWRNSPWRVGPDGCIGMFSQEWVEVLPDVKPFIRNQLNNIQ